LQKKKTKNHEAKIGKKSMRMKSKKQLLQKNTTRKLINTNGNTEGITVGKKIKTKQKKMMTCHFYQRNYRRNKFRW
jgi:hypothetical protein